MEKSKLSGVPEPLVVSDNHDRERILTLVLNSSGKIIAINAYHPCHYDGRLAGSGSGYPYSSKSCIHCRAPYISDFSPLIHSKFPVLPSSTQLQSASSFLYKKRYRNAHACSSRVKT